MLTFKTIEKKYKKGILNMYSNGATLREVGDKYDVSYETIRKIIPKKLRRHNHLTKKMKKAIYAFHLQSGSSLKYTASIFRRSFRTIKKIIEEKK